MPTLLTPCPSCKRHIRDGESTCPFCGKRVQLVRHVTSDSRALPTLRRAVLIAAGAAVATVGCQPADIPPYGAPPVFDTEAGAGDASADAADASLPALAPLGPDGCPPQYEVCESMTLGGVACVLEDGGDVCPP